MVRVVEVIMVVDMISVVGVVKVVLVVGVFEEAKCPKKKKSVTHFKTMPQAAGKNLARQILTQVNPPQNSKFKRNFLDQELGKRCLKSK